MRTPPVLPYPTFPTYSGNIKHLRPLMRHDNEALKTEIIVEKGQSLKRSLNF